MPVAADPSDPTKRRAVGKPCTTTFGNGAGTAALHGSGSTADSAFDTHDARRVCFNYRLIPNMAEHKRNRKTIKRGRKRRFNAQVYKRRFCSERSFAWIDKFRALLIRHDRKDVYFWAAHHLVFTLINLRHQLAPKA